MTATIAGNLKDIFGAAVNGASLVVQLCGFGSSLPRAVAYVADPDMPPPVSDNGLLARTAPDIIACPAGTYRFTVYGNDVILPAGTYYLVQVLDNRRNVVQTAAYQFTSNLTYALDAATPYNLQPSYTPTPNATGFVVKNFDPGTIGDPVAVGDHVVCTLAVPAATFYEVELSGMGNIDGGAVWLRIGSGYNVLAFPQGGGGSTPLFKLRASVAGMDFSEPTFERVYRDSDLVSHADYEVGGNVGDMRNGFNAVAGVSGPANGAVTFLHFVAKTYL